MEQEGNLTRTAMGAIHDDNKAFQTEIYNKKVAEANQAPPTSCTGDTIMQILFNEYPQVERLRTRNTYINLNEIIRRSVSQTRSEMRNKREEQRREELEKWPKDEQLDASIPRKDTLTGGDLEKVEAFNRALIDPLASQLQALPESAIGQPNAEEYEANRQSLLARLSQVVEEREAEKAKRIGAAGRLEALQRDVDRLRSSKDSRDASYGAGLQRIIDQIKSEQGSQISYQTVDKAKLDFRSIPEYDEYIRNLGGEAAPLLKELIFIERDGLKNAQQRLEQQEKTNGLLASMLQTSLDTEVKLLKMTDQYEDLTVTTRVPIL
jgi:hypothetical protein